MGFSLEGEILWYILFCDICACLEMTAHTNWGHSLWKEALVPRHREFTVNETSKNK